MIHEKTHELHFINSLPGFVFIFSTFVHACLRILWKLIPFMCNKTQLLTDAHKDATEGTN